MYCIKCGKQINEGDNFCCHCGVKVNEKTSFKATLVVGKKTFSENPNMEAEKAVLVKWIKYFTNKYDRALFSIVKNSKDYTTLKYKAFDIIRLKYSPTSKWIKIFMTPDNKKQYINNHLFDLQKRKNELYWKGIIEEEKDIEEYVKIINDSIEYFKE